MNAINYSSGKIKLLWIIVAILAIALLVLNVVIPQVQKQQRNKLSAQVQSLATQYKATNNSSGQAQIAAQVRNLVGQQPGKTAAMKASAQNLGYLDPYGIGDYFVVFCIDVARYPDGSGASGVAFDACMKYFADTGIGY